MLQISWRQFSAIMINQQWLQGGIIAYCHCRNIIRAHGKSTNAFLDWPFEIIKNHES